MLKIGVSSGNSLFSDSYWSDLSEGDIDVTEISVDYLLYKDLDYKAIKENADKYGIKLWSYHLPFWPFTEIDCSSTDKAIRDYTIKYFTELIEKATAIGIDKFIVHPSGEPVEGSDRPERIKYCKETLSRLADVAEKHGAVICVEDLPRTCLGNTADEMLEIISDDKRLMVCFDTNHLLIDNNIDFVRKVGKRIVTTHVSDYDFTNEKHWFPGEGDQDFVALYKELEKVGYNGVWLYEANRKAPATMTRPRDLTFAEFRENALTIFKGEHPKAFGTRK